MSRALLTDRGRRPSGFRRKNDIDPGGACQLFHGVKKDESNPFFRRNTRRQAPDHPVRSASSTPSAFYYARQ